MRLPSSKPMMSRGGRGGKGAPAPKGGGGLGIRPTSAFWIGRALMRDKDREESMILGGQGRQLLETGRAGEFGRMSQQYDQAIQTLDDMLEGGMEP